MIDRIGRDPELCKVIFDHHRLAYKENCNTIALQGEMILWLWMQHFNPQIDSAVGAGRKRFTAVYGHLGSLRLYGCFAQQSLQEGGIHFVRRFYLA